MLQTKVKSDKKKGRGLYTGQEGGSEMRLGDTMRDDTLQKNLEMYQTKPHEICGTSKKSGHDKAINLNLVKIIF